MLYAIYRMTAIYNPTTGIIAKVTFEIEIRKMMEEINNSSLVCFVSTPFTFGLVFHRATDTPSSLPARIAKNTSRWAGSGEWGESSERAVPMGHFSSLVNERGRAGLLFSWHISQSEIWSDPGEKTTWQREASILPVEPAGIHSQPSTADTVTVLLTKKSRRLAWYLRASSALWSVPSLIQTFSRSAFWGRWSSGNTMSVVSKEGES